MDIFIKFYRICDLELKNMIFLFNFGYFGNN